MTLIEMIDEIDRLVSNNGAVSDIKPFLIQVREQAEALEKRVRALESKSKVKDLEGQVSFLRAELDAALKQIEELESGKQGTHGSDRSDIETKILLMLAEASYPTTGQVASYIQQGYEAAMYHLRELEKVYFVTSQTDMYENSLWSLMQDGRGYLMKRNLLK